jgi:hypothetical protein
MSDDVIALLITVAIIALCFVWVPLLNFICPPCSRFLERRGLQKEIPPQRTPVNMVRQKTL